MLRRLVILACCVFHVACGSPESEISAAVAQTVEAMTTSQATPVPQSVFADTPIPAPATITLRPIDTLSPPTRATDTPRPTDTPMPTATSTLEPTETSTSTPVPTPTREGPCATVTSFKRLLSGPGEEYEATLHSVVTSEIVCLEQKSEDGLWFIVKKDSNSGGWLPAEFLEGVNEEDVAKLSVELVPTVTVTSTPTLTPTTEPTVDVRSLYDEVDLRDLDAYPSSHRGEKVKIRGSVFNIFEISGGLFTSTAFQLEIGDVIVVVTGLGDVEIPDGVYEGTWITVYGTVEGSFVGTNAFGGTISQPEVDADFIEK